MTETDERGHSTTSIYRAYGAPDNQPVLIWLKAPEDVLSVIGRNSIGLVTTLWQGSQQSQRGYQRTYSYDEHLFLVAMKHPETGTTVFGRDAVGNLISRQVGASESTHYQYDGLNRLIQIDCPEPTPDVTQVYDANGNMTQSITADAMREAIYDENGNLTTETLTIGGHPFTINYTFDLLDAVSTMHLVRQVVCHPDSQEHVMPGNAVLPAHEGMIITRGLQEWACLLPQELPFASVRRLLGWQASQEHVVCPSTAG